MRERPSPNPISWNGYILTFDKPRIMGILNITPDSFSDGGKYCTLSRAIDHALKMVEEGADIIDVGGESSRPGCNPIAGEEELRRVIPVIKELTKNSHLLLSIDTYKPRVAEICLDLGAQIINDIEGLRNPLMRRVAQQYNVPVIIMHMPGVPRTMQKYVYQTDIVTEVRSFFAQRMAEVKTDGIDKIILDPGLGFGKTPEQNYHLLAHLTELNNNDYPLLIGPSRKTIGQARKLTTTEALALGIKNGTNLIRVHDVQSTKIAIDMTRE